MSDTVRVLLVEDNPGDVDLIREMLAARGPVSFETEFVSRLSEARARLKGGGIDVLLIDLGLPDSQGLETLRQLQAAAPAIPAIVLTGMDDLEAATTAVREGAQDYIVKGQLDGGQLARAVRYAVERKRVEKERTRRLLRQQGINRLQQSLLVAAPLENKLKSVTDGIVRLFDADFCRIWLIRPGDLCGCGCVHAGVNEGPHVCRHRDRCLHLLASSGRYTHTDGPTHRRVPFGCYKIGLIASGQDHKFLTNDAQNDPRVHNHEWARAAGLASFAGYQLRVAGGETLGVLALFAKQPILPAEDAMLDGISSSVALIIQQSSAAEELRESEGRFRHVSSAISDIAYSCSTGADGGYVIDWLIGAAERVTGYSIDEIKSRGCWSTLVLEEDRPLFVKHVVGLSPGSSSACELRLRHKDGGIVWVASFAESVKNQEPSEHLHIYGGLVNITERKLAAEELRKHRDHLEELVKERTAELQSLVKAMTGREVRMAELKDVIAKLREQLEARGIKPEAEDPLAE